MLPVCCRARWRLVVLVLLLLSTILSLYRWNQSFVVQQDEAPLDHIKSTLRKPFYYSTCPDIPIFPLHPNENFVPFLMISARTPAEVLPILDSWQGFPIQLVSTRNFSTSYRNVKCNSVTFKSRLFAVYQEVLGRNFYWNSNMTTSTHVVVLEDDVKLLARDALLSELEWAVMHDLDYYSFFRNTNNTCIYNFGAVAQVMSRRLVQTILEAGNDSFCRLPLDMFVAQQGPWYVTQRDLVQHVGKRVQIQERRRRKRGLKSQVGGRPLGKVLF